MFNLLLSALLIFDILFLTCNLLKNIAKHFVEIPAEYFRSYYLLVYACTRCSFIASVSMTLALSHSRYNAITKPIQYRNSMNTHERCIRHFLKYIIVILILSSILTIPSFWEFESKNDVNPILVPTSLRQNPFYSTFYVGVLSLGLLGMLPFTLIVYFTININRKINRAVTTTGHNTKSSQRNRILYYY